MTLEKGQPVFWPHSADGLAQIDELRRRRVRLVYRTARGRLRFATVKPAELAGKLHQFLLPGLFNPLQRGIVGSPSRTYEEPHGTQTQTR